MINRRYTVNNPSKTHGFVGTVSFHQNSDGRNFTVDEDFRFITTSGLRIVVPKGFVTDLASTPRPIWFLLPPCGCYTDAAIVHDFCYRNKGVVSPIFHTLSRRESDSVLLQGMRDRNTPSWQIFTIYWAVRLFGWIPWRRHQGEK